ncbi:hypothetical protein C7H19_05930 [Aphanothece hegewaldii CCALA 016]|uniref:Uncharacterized protein n=1 Tax=Aphanothece hegewaldii CCALA 016 TaxID=2107694 RepID=A0A2T1M1G4_9CHRO|nr:hypothetical protein [Aphanothece hegewaldii]PSF38521.1 hypothetical protein C7H19_05930 [Aphanothece hegewaldii CCALA 016]
MNHYLSSKISPKWLRLVPFLAMGGIIFTFNSTLELNYMIRGYLLFLEAQIGIVILYYWVTKVIRTNKKMSNLKGKKKDEK